MKLGGSVPDPKALQDPKKERWQILCEQAAVEQDPDKLLALVSELSEALAETEQRLNSRRKTGDPKVPEGPADSKPK